MLLEQSRGLLAGCLEEVTSEQTPGKWTVGRYGECECIGESKGARRMTALGQTPPQR